jgi:hypothetical protein
VSEATPLVSDSPVCGSIWVAVDMRPCPLQTTENSKLYYVQKGATAGQLFDWCVGNLEAASKPAELKSSAHYIIQLNH